MFAQGGGAEAAAAEAAAHALEIPLAIVAVVTALIGFGIAFWLYISKPAKPGELAKSMQGVYTTLLNKYYVDELYAAVVVKPLMWISTQVSLEDRRRADDRRHRQRHRARHDGSRRRRPPRAVRQHAQLRRLGRHRRDCVVIAIIFWPYLQPRPSGWCADVAARHLLSVLIFFPALGALALLLLRGDDHVWIRRLALTISIVEFLLLALSDSGVPIGVAGYSLVEYYNWIAVPPIHYHLGVDGISLFLVILTTFLTPISILASWNSIDHRVKEFFIMLLMLEVGVIGVFLSLDLFLFFLFWEVMLIPMYFLIGIWGHERRIYAAIKFVLYTMAGSILMLVGIIWLYNLTGTLRSAEDSASAAGRPACSRCTSQQEMLLFLAFFVAFAIKVPLFPLHTWLPDAHVEAPTAGSVMLAGVLLKMGTYGMIRFCLPLFPECRAPCCARDCGAGDHRHHLRRAGRAGPAQSEKTRRLFQRQPPGLRRPRASSRSTTSPCRARSTRCSLTASPPARSSCWSACSTTAATRSRSREFGGLATPMPKLAAFFLFVALSSLGLPMLNGFVGEFLILLGTFQTARELGQLGRHSASFSPPAICCGPTSACSSAKSPYEKNSTLPDASARERSDSRHHGRHHALDGHRLDVLHAPHRGLEPERSGTDAALRTRRKRSAPAIPSSIVS